MVETKEYLYKLLPQCLKLKEREKLNRTVRLVSTLSLGIEKG